jgi:hypothetical protein
MGLQSHHMPRGRLSKDVGKDKVFKETEGVLETIWRALGGVPSGEGPEGAA